MRSTRLSTLACVVIVLLAGLAHAQNVPENVKQGQINSGFEVSPEPRTVPDGLELTAPMIRPPANADSYRFTLKGLSIRGVTSYSSDELLAEHRTAIGSEISLADLYRISNAITARYRNDGYILSQVFPPAQTIVDGQVELQAVEGFVADVSFQGATKGRRGMLQKMAARIKASRPLNSSVLERNLLLMNDLPGAIAQGTLQASASVPGAANLIVTFFHDNVDFSVDANNRASEFLGPEQVGVGLTLNSVLGAYESTSLNYIKATDSDELEFVYISHSQQLSSTGLKATVSASRSDSVPGLGADFAAFNLETSSDDVSLRFDYPLKRSRASNAYLFGRLTRHDGATNSSFFTEQSADVISSLRLGVTFDTVDRFRGVNVLEFEISKGIDVFSASQKGDPLLSRPGGDPEYTKATIYAARLQSLAPRWSLLLALRGQYGFDNLLSPEEFSFGGENFGRAYDPSELVGDDGAAAKLELRYTRQGRSGSGVTLYTFYDVGFVEQELGPMEFVQKTRESAAAAGLGLRFNIGRQVSGYVEGAVPLTRNVSAKGDDDVRVFGGFRVRF